MRAQIEIRLLGAFSLHVAGREVRLRLARAKSLLAYLAVEARPHSREALAGLFWPDLDPTAAMLSLRQVIHHLRSATDSDAGGDDGLLAANRHTVRLTSSACRVDASEFLLFSGRGDLEQAASLYQGEFLADVPVGGGPFHDWLEMTRRMFHSRALMVLSGLMEQRTVAGDLTGAQHWAEQKIRIDPLDESAHRELMKIHLAQGQRHRAIAQFEQLSCLLKEELGIDPAPETVKLYQGLLAGGSSGSAMPEGGLSALQRQKLTYYFRLADDDGDGYIRPDEFRRRGEFMCRRIGLDCRSGVGRKLCDVLVEFWNGFGDLLEIDRGEPLRLEQWLAFWSRWNGIVSEQAARRDLAEVQYRKDLTLVWFDALDTDGDGLIDAREYSHWLHAWGSRIDADSTFRRLDADGDDRLSRNDVLAVATEFFLSSDPEARGNYFLGDPFLCGD